MAKETAKAFDVRLSPDMPGNHDNQGWLITDHPWRFPINSRNAENRGNRSFQGGNAMPKYKSVIAGLAISTALTGGVVGLGAATTVTSASATITTVTAAAFPTCGGGWGRGCGCCGCRSHHRRSHHRFRLIINNHNNNDNDLDNDNRNDRLVPVLTHHES